MLNCHLTTPKIPNYTFYSVLKQNGITKKRRNLFLRRNGAYHSGSGCLPLQITMLLRHLRSKDPGLNRRPSPTTYLPIATISPWHSGHLASLYSATRRSILQSANIQVTNVSLAYEYCVIIHDCHIDSIKLTYWLQTTRRKYMHYV